MLNVTVSLCSICTQCIRCYMTTNDCAVNHVVSFCWLSVHLSYMFHKVSHNKFSYFSHVFCFQYHFTFYCPWLQSAAPIWPWTILWPSLITKQTKIAYIPFIRIVWITCRHCVFTTQSKNNKLQCTPVQSDWTSNQSHFQNWIGAQRVHICN